MFELSWQHDFYLTILTSVGQCREAEINRKERERLMIMEMIIMI